jgi:hypothetical protein
MKYTLEQFMKLNILSEQYSDDQVKLYSELSKLLFNKETINIKKTDADIIISDFINTIKEEPKFIQRFKHNGIEYGFIPNFDNITVAEYVDLDVYSRENVQQANKLMSILYRPIIKKSYDNYQIEEYNGTSKYSDIMLGIDYSIYLSAMVFFWNLEKELGNYLTIYSEKQTTS